MPDAPAAVPPPSESAKKSVLRIAGNQGQANGLPSDSPALLVNEQGEVVDANSAAVALICGDVAQDDLVGTFLRDLLSVQTDSSLSTLHRRDGRTLTVRVARWSQGPHQVLLLVDVSDLATAADELREEQRRLTEVQRVAKIGSWEFDCKSRTSVWSIGHYEILGLKPGQVLPSIDTYLASVHPEDRDEVHNIWLSHQEPDGEDTAIIANRIVLPTGEIRRVISELRFCRDENRAPLTITGFIRDVTQQWQIENELAAEQARLLEAQRVAKMGSWTYEVATKHLYRSEAFKEIYKSQGMKPTKFLTDRIHPEDKPLVAEVQKAMFHAEDGEILEFEARGAASHKNYYCRIRAEHDSRGRLARLHGTLQDVSEQRLLERQLLEERRRLADAQRVARLGTWQWDPDTDDIECSEVMRELLGVTPSEPFTFQRYLQAVHFEDRDQITELWQRLSLDHRPLDCEHRVIRADGVLRFFRCHGAAVPGPDGELLLVGAVQDVTEQHAAAVRVERSSQRFSDLVSVTPVGIGIFDGHERLIDANDALCDLLGYDLEQLKGQTAEQLTHPDDRVRVGQIFGLADGAASDGSGRIPQRIVLRADGEPVYCELHLSQSVQDDGRGFWLVVFQDITERLRAAEALKHQATHDDLTGLPNRAAIKELLHRLLGGDDAHGVAVLFCDIDNFKRVNDSLGHDAGDELLVALARRMEGGLPPGCTAARLSGDEFLVICEDIDAVGGVDQLAMKVSGLLRTAIPVHGQLVRVSASIGAAVPNGSRAAGEDLLRFADAAMFEAKRQGAGRVALANAALMASADRQVHLEGQLRDALNRDGLTLHFQPVVGADGSVLTAEALVRWPHPDRGLLAPDVFLPVAEQGDLLRELDRWVLRTALREAAGWRAPGGAPVSVAVNLSGLVPGDPDFVDSVATAVAEAGISWDRVILELVETSFVDLPSRTRQAMAELVDRGVRFAVDDFGTGYSSLARLKDLPAQIVKVDRRFVSGVGNDPSDFAVARAVVDMARAMGRSCVAEGVETATQFHVLRGVGVDAYQGWLFSRAIPAREFRTLLNLGPLHVPRAG
ncbi:EAL domain-containing protein [Pseudonocardiaceae bacterium YIM PH 21723]|nr:EAL domain-containing protein [Pseudonocardiaceae bacterium YIM PH 21723]